MTAVNVLMVSLAWVMDILGMLFWVSWRMACGTADEHKSFSMKRSCFLVAGMVFIAFSFDIGRIAFPSIVGLFAGLV